MAREITFFKSPAIALLGSEERRGMRKRVCVCVCVCVRERERQRERDRERER